MKGTTFSVSEYFVFVTVSYVKTISQVYTKSVEELMQHTLPNIWLALLALGITHLLQYLVSLSVFKIVTYTAQKHTEWSTLCGDISLQ
jgi:hypothetical protein